MSYANLNHWVRRDVHEAEVERLREENAELRRLLNPPKDPHEWTPFDGTPEPAADSPPFPNETATMGSDG